MKKIDFSGENTRRNVAGAVVPLLVAQLLSLLYSIVDRVYIGRMPEEGVAGLAGIGLCFPIVMMVTAFTNLYGMGGAPLCAIARGRGDKAEAERVMNTSASLLLCTALALLLLFEGAAEPLLRAFGASEAMLPHAMRYLRIYLLGTPATMLASGLNPFINAQGFSGVGMLSIALGAVLNIALDPLFIFGFRMGVQGAAIATVISQAASMLWVLRFLLGKQAEERLAFLMPSQWGRKRVSDILGLGVASFIMQVTNSLVAIVCNQTLALYGGDLYISVYTVVSSVRQILDVPVHAITTGASPVLSFHYGANRPDRMKETVRIFARWAILYTLIIWLLILLAPGLFIRVFSTDVSLLAPTKTALRIYFAAFVFQAFQYCGQAVFTALGKKHKAIFFSLFRKVIMVVPLTLWLPRLFSLGAAGVFLAEPISNLIGGGACFATMWMTEYRRWGTRA